MGVGLDQATGRDARSAPVMSMKPLADSYYPQLLDDLLILRLLLLDLSSDLIVSAGFTEGPASGVQRLESARELLSDELLEQPSLDRLIDRLKRSFKALRDAEDDLTAAPEIVARHALKLQHLDLAMQLLTNVIVKLAVPSEANPLMAARLQNLRGCCRQAMHAN